MGPTLELGGGQILGVDSGRFRGSIGSLALLGLGLLFDSMAPADAAGAPACDQRRAAVYQRAGDRYRTQRDFSTAARWYLAAHESTDGCATASAAMLNARALAQAGTAFAQAGDYLRALTLLRVAQSRLTGLTARDPQAASDARAYADRVQNLISAIDEVAQSSM